MKVKRMQLGERPDVELEDTLGPAKNDPSLADAENVGTFAIDEDEDIELNQSASLDSLFSQDDINFLQDSREHPGFSFDSIIAPEQEKQEDVEYKAKNIKVNHLLVIRKPIKVTPSMCRAVGCNYDSAVANGFPGGWESIPKARRHIFAELVKQHSARYHSGIESHIIKKSQMPKNWLHKG